MIKNSPPSIAMPCINSSSSFFSENKLYTVMNYPNKHPERSGVPHTIQSFPHTECAGFSFGKNWSFMGFYKY